MTVTEENNFDFLDLNLERKNSILGFNDAILGICYINSKQIAMATQSDVVCIFYLF